jgi:DNA-binding response OmpR family regulator
MIRLKLKGVGTVARILIVEDDGVLRFDMAQTILGWGHDIRTAASALAGFRIIKDWQPHVVLSDIYMPHITGYELKRQVSKLNINKSDMAFFFITQLHKSQIDTADDALRADEYISKPVDYGNLKDKIEAALWRNKSCNSKPKAAHNYSL